MIPDVAKANGMRWNQIADGMYWEAWVGKAYAVRAIPQAFIVDGDTGLVYAEGEKLRGTTSCLP